MSANTPTRAPAHTNQLTKNTIIRTADLNTLKRDNNSLRIDNLAIITQNTEVIHQNRQLMTENVTLRNQLSVFRQMQQTMQAQINHLKQEKLVLEEAMTEWARLEWVWKGEKAQLEAVVRNLHAEIDVLRPLGD